MSHGLRTTFNLLTETANDAAATLLVSALDHPLRDVREGALTALLCRRSSVGRHEIVRRLHTFDEPANAIVAEHGTKLSAALRDAALAADPQLCINACQAILRFSEYDLMPALVNALEDEGNTNAAVAAETVLALAERLYDELAGRHNFKPRRDPNLVRSHLIAALEKSAQRYPRHKRIEVVEAFLLLTPRDNAVLKLILHDPLHVAYLPLIDVLAHSQRPGVLRLVLSYLDDPQAPSAALNVLGRRCDEKFVHCLLRKIGNEPAGAVRQNLGRIETISWLRDESVLSALDGAGQHSAVQLLMASGAKRLNVFETIAGLATQGKPGGRRAAVAAMAEFHGAEANRLVLNAMYEEDPQVKATAVAQLRARGIPGALAMLIDLIDSPQPAVRQAARENLSEFSFARYLSAFEMLDDEVRRSTGMMVRRIDSTTLPQLREEMASPARRRRLRAVQVAAAMNVADELIETIAGLLTDDDHLVRVEAARALAQCESEAAVTSLQQASNDSSLAVRETAIQGLEQIARRAAAPQAATSSPAVEVSI